VGLTGKLEIGSEKKSGTTSATLPLIMSVKIEPLGE
jgi:hypothetical protein